MYIILGIAHKRLLFNGIRGVEKQGDLRLNLYCGIKYFVLWCVLARTVVQMSAHCGVNLDAF